MLRGLDYPSLVAESDRTWSTVLSLVLKWRCGLIYHLSRVLRPDLSLQGLHLSISVG